LHEALEALDDAYEGCAADPMCGRKGEKLNSSIAETYGELLPTTVAYMLALAGARPGQRYYDLGSGTGKTVYLAGLLGLNATGVELVPNRTRVACDALGRPVKTGHFEKGSMNFVTGSFLAVDFSDADVVFTDSVMFSDDLKEGLARIARRMKPGAKVISFNGLPSPGFSTQKESFVGPTSWSPSTTWTIQTVDSSGAGTTHRVAASPGDAPGLACRSGGQLARL
jgi:SAM-dependent methyltransferase